MHPLFCYAKSKTYLPLTVASRIYLFFARFFSHAIFLQPSMCCHVMTPSMEKEINLAFFIRDHLYFLCQQGEPCWQEGEPNWISAKNDLVIISREEFSAGWWSIPREFSPTISPLVLHSSSLADWDGELIALDNFLPWNYHTLVNKFGDFHSWEISSTLPPSSHVPDVDQLSIN